MESRENSAINTLRRIDPRLLLSLAAVFVWGLLAHAYAFTNLTVSHDSLNEFALSGPIRYADGSVLRWKLSLGRFLQPPYRLLFSGATSSPWLIGILSLVWLSLAVWLTVRMFGIKRRLSIVLVSGIFTTNLTVTALAATYIHDLDADMLAVLTAALAAYLWSLGGRKQWLTLPCVLVTLALYQPMLSVTLSLILFLSILRLLQGRRAKQVFSGGLAAIGLILLAGLLYLALTKLICVLSGVALESGYNGLSRLWNRSDTSLLSLLAGCYRFWGGSLLVQESGSSTAAVCILTALLAAAAVYAVIFASVRQRLPRQSTLLILLLLLLLPAAMNLSYLASGGMCHDLMKFAFWLIYLPSILLSEYRPEQDGDGTLHSLLRGGVCIALLLLLWGNVQTSNAVYVKKDLERQATLSLMTRVCASIEQTEGYVSGETPVLFVGAPSGVLSEIDDFDRVKTLTGVSFSLISFESYYGAYFEYMLQTPIHAITDKALLRSSAVTEMPCYPQSGCIQWINGVLVVKLGEYSGK